MKTLSSYITEKLKIGGDSDPYLYHPADHDELKELVEKLINERGNDADLNDIDVSGVKDMGGMFGFSEFNGDISKWDVSNVT